MSSELEQLELLSLLNSITKELINHTGLNDPVLAEFLIELHSTSKNQQQFKANCAGVGAEFPDSFLASVDRLILGMHPKYKKKSAVPVPAATASKVLPAAEAQVLDEDRERQMRLFPGLAMKDQEWEPSFKADPLGMPKGKGLEIHPAEENLLAEFEGVNKRMGGADDDGGRKRMRQRSPDYNQGSSRGGDDRGRGRDGYGGARDNGWGRGAPKRLDDQPVLYKVYPGKVAGIKDFGAFVSLEGVAGRAEGTCSLVDGCRH